MNEADVIEPFNSNSLNFDGLFNINNPYFEGMVNQIYLTNFSCTKTTPQKPNPHFFGSFLCLNGCLATQLTVMAMSERCLHFKGLLPKLRMS